MKPRRNLHRDPTGARLGAPAPNPLELAARLERRRAVPSKRIAKRALRAGVGATISAGDRRLYVKRIDSGRILLVDATGLAIVVPRP